MAIISRDEEGRGEQLVRRLKNSKDISGLGREKQMSSCRDIRASSAHLPQKTLPASRLVAYGLGKRLTLAGFAMLAKGALPHLSTTLVKSANSGT